MYYNFEALEKMSMSELKKVKAFQANELAKAMQRRYDLIGAILFYQSEREKLEADNQNDTERR